MDEFNLGEFGDFEDDEFDYDDLELFEDNITDDVTSESLDNLLGELFKEKNEIDNNISTKLEAEKEPSEKEESNFTAIVSDKGDIQQGVNYLRRERRMDVDDKWETNPGNEVLGGKSESTENVGVEYPIILVEVVTKIMLDNVKSIVEENYKENGTGVYLKMGEDAVFLGNSFISHKAYGKLIRLGLKPIYYVKKGISKEYKPEDLFDPSIYNPRILDYQDEDILKNPMETLIPEETYGQPLHESHMPDDVPIDLDELLWLNSQSIHSEEYRENLEPDKSETVQNTDNVLSDLVWGTDS